MAKTAKRTVHKNSITIKGEVEFFVKKTNKSFGLSVFNGKGEILTTLYGSLNRKVRNSNQTIGELIGVSEKKEVVEKKSGGSIKSVVEKKSGGSIKSSVIDADYQAFVQFKKFQAMMKS